jgi:hypothetical protein
LSVCVGRIVGERETTADASYLLAQRAHWNFFLFA